MKNSSIAGQFEDQTDLQRENFFLLNQEYTQISLEKPEQLLLRDYSTDTPEILVISSFPPRECGIATYSQDLITSLNNKFSNSLSIKVCAMESDETDYPYPADVKYVLKTSIAAEYRNLSSKINNDSRIKIVLIQHEFGFFKEQERSFLLFLSELTKPVVIVFHTVLPHPAEKLKRKIKNIAACCESIIVMTHTSKGILTTDYNLPEEKISVIAHGTHLVPHLSKKFLKEKYGLKGRKVLSTFGLLSSGKSIETTLEALPAIIKQSPNVVFLVIGKTHPEVVKYEGEKYRAMLEETVTRNSLQDHVLFINKYLPLDDLLEYLQLTDIYLFTTNDPNQAVSGTFAYAMSCACPIISTPIPHARELLNGDIGIIFDFQNSGQLADAVIRLLNDEPLRKSISTSTLQKIVFSTWENSAVSHARLFEKIAGDHITLRYNLPVFDLSHIKEMTTSTGIIQFAKINQPDICSGYTLDDNARALVAMCMYYKETGDKESLYYIRKYLSFIKRCQQPSGIFLNYMDSDNNFTGQNKKSNLDDANGRTAWALGYVISLTALLPWEIISKAKTIFNNTVKHLEKIHSTRSMGFAIKGLYYFASTISTPEYLILLKKFADRLVQMYRHESREDWKWYESYLTYANSILPEALLYAWKITGDPVYKEIAVSSFDFLLSQIYNENGIEVISNKNWLQKGEEKGHFGEQPIDVSYTIMTLSAFLDEFQDEDYRSKMETAFNWFLGSNRLHQIIYNPCTGGCYDGLEEFNINLNQGAESTVSYLMARCTIEKYNHENKIPIL